MCIAEPLQHGDLLQQALLLLLKPGNLKLQPLCLPDNLLAQGSDSCVVLTSGVSCNSVYALTFRVVIVAGASAPSTFGANDWLPVIA